MKKLLMCLMFLLLPVLVLSGCSKGQITMLQIEEAMPELEKPQIENAVTIYDLSKTKSDASQLLRWQSNFERQNVDTEKFMALDTYYFYCQKIVDGHYEYIDFTVTLVFKFAEDKHAKNCYKNYDFEDNFVVKQYGNLVVAVDENYADLVYPCIDNIKAK